MPRAHRVLGAVPNPDGPSFVYALIRSDLTLPQQLVQTAHATHESGGQFGAPAGCHLIVLVVANEAVLRAHRDRLVAAGIPLVLFTEPDLGDAATALATGPLTQADRLHFRGMSLWKPVDAVPETKPC